MSKIGKITSIFFCIVFSIAGLLAVGLSLAIKMSARGTAVASIAVIGGADGPTSIFLAGKVGNGSLAGLVAVGVVFLVLAGLCAAFSRTKGKGKDTRGQDA